MLSFTYLLYLIKRSKKESLLSKRETEIEKENKRQKGEREQREAMRQGGRNIA